MVCIFKRAKHHSQQAKTEHCIQFFAFIDKLSFLKIPTSLRHPPHLTTVDHIRNLIYVQVGFFFSNIFFLHQQQQQRGEEEHIQKRKKGLKFEILPACRVKKTGCRVSL